MSEQVEKIYAELKQVFDPEIPVNIVDLGLVYDVKVDGPRANVVMTLTSQACPEAKTIPDVVRRRCTTVEGIQEVAVDVVWDPPWTPQRITKAGRELLGMGEE